MEKKINDVLNIMENHGTGPLCFHFYFLIKLQPQNDTESNSEVARQVLPRKILNEKERQRLWNQESMRASITDPTAALWDENEDSRGSVEMSAKDAY